ncbi:MAG: efflux RND transporter periplasmic adaptor subunit [Bacteroidales bacterium]|jgi:membrane fusion protein (multidrug efflux system)|nr:efflux RND transporter periplasmic adaptor subunit [Bacteroidales bacterium]MDD2632463.1 efflux RND transporter periplasmic adaptor subunit [Bacteroidales bacterium]MDD3131776.1 efflux RND transporter periplasmic adaptor subunit [Bacteroidales bacterium]MDY0334033.1 efflux RND transporter periplasmic adaptor subunit [Bacteroidales bacterium]NLO49944.1 efflux RND transporter periplasmic adaptor subunit [Bacteroidales bacterium]
MKHFTLRRSCFMLMALPIIMLLAFGCNRQDASPPPPTKVVAVKVERRDIPIYQDFVGQVYGLQDIAIRARVEGVLEAMHFKEGTFVKKGQLLYTIDPLPLQTKVAAQMSGVAQAKTMLAKAESDLKRIRPLAANNAVSQRDLDAAVAQRDAAQAALEAAEANLESADIELGYSLIKAPIDGIIGKTMAKVGDFVGRSPNPIVLNYISNIDDVVVEFFLSEQEYLYFARQLIKMRDNGDTAADASERLSLILADQSIYPEPGRLNFVDRQVDPSTGSILLQATFPNPDKLLRPGQFARVKARIALVPQARIIPLKALNEIQGQYSVYVVNDSAIVEVRPVKQGAIYQDYAVISEGLQGDEVVIIEGLQKVKSGTRVDAQMVTYQSKTEQTNDDSNGKK